MDKLLHPSDWGLIPLVGQVVPVEPGARGFAIPGLSWDYLWNLIAALLILVIGIIVASVLSSITKRLLKQTRIDNRLASWITGSSDETKLPVENWIAGAVYALVLIFVFVAFLERLQLTFVSQPLNNFLNQILSFLPQIGGALILLGIAWAIASIVKLVVTRGLRAIDLDRRLGQHMDQAEGSDQIALSETLGSALYWFIFLLFLPSILSVLELEGTLRPVQSLVEGILNIVPNILAAILIAAAGWLVATVVRRIVTNLLAASGADSFGTRFGLNQSRMGQSLSGLAGTIVYILILIPFAIAALNALRIEAISVPAIAMLEQILLAVPLILAAAAILFFAYVLGRFVADLISNLLSSVGFDNLFYWLGLQSRPTPTRITHDPITQEPIPLDEQPTILQSDRGGLKSPSELVGIIVLVGIMLFAILTAAEVLQLTALTLIVGGLLQISGQVLVGLIVFAVGLYIANLVFSLIVSSGTRNARFLAQSARVTLLILVGAMALRQMGIASDIVNLAFGLLLGAVAVAIAISFGLGGREVAADQLREWLASFKEDKSLH